MNDIALINTFCFTDDLKTYDPYDIWKDNIGLRIKKLYYQNKWALFLPAGFFYISDFFLNNFLQKVYVPQEYPIVRALACLTLLNCFKKTGDQKYLKFAKMHLKWLVLHTSESFSGFCWGLNFKWASKNGVYKQNTPFITMTPYVMEALIKYQQYSSTDIFDDIIKSILYFVEKDIIVKQDKKDVLALSYAPLNEPRIVINANSYALFLYSMLLDYFPEKENCILNKINRIYNFIVKNQNIDGSWFYYADNLSGNFIDCFHSCFILKNMIKSSNLSSKIKIDYSVIRKGAAYLDKKFMDTRTGLFKRFAVTDVPSLIKFDLYDNAEMLQLYFLLGEKNNYNELKNNIHKNFVYKNNIFSKIDIFGKQGFKNHLRWAVMPYLYALSLTL